MGLAVVAGCAADGPCDGTIDLGEECDDGNQDPHDRCDCTAQPPWVPPQGALSPEGFVVVEDDGAWCWFQDERALFVGDRLVVSSVSHGGDIHLSSYDIASGVRDHGVVRRGLERDDHDAASLFVRPDGRLTAFYTRHDGDDTMYWRTQAGDGLGNWEAERSFEIIDDISYSNPFSLADGLHLFFRGASYNPTVAVSLDHGDTFGEPRQLIDSHTTTAGYRTNQRPYVKYASNGTDTVHLLYTDGHPNELDSTSIYHLVYRGGRLFRSDGAPVEDDMPAPNAGTKIHDGPTQGEAWIWDTALDGELPVAVFATIVDGVHEYHYARWDGAWQVHPIAGGGGALYVAQQFYSGGIAIDPDDPHIVYFSANVDPTTGATTPHFELYRGVTTDLGTSWTITTITAGSTVDNIRPVVPAHHPTPTAVVWMQGTYHSYTDWDTRIVALLGAADATVPARAVTERPPIAQFDIDDRMQSIDDRLVATNGDVTLEVWNVAGTGDSGRGGELQRDTVTGRGGGADRLRVRVHGLVAGGRYSVRLHAYAPFECYLEPTLWFRAGAGDDMVESAAFLGAHRPGNSPEPGDGSLDVSVTADELGRIELVSSTLDGDGATVLGGVSIYERPATRELARFDVDTHAGVATAPGFTSLAIEEFRGTATGNGVTVSIAGDRRSYATAGGDSSLVESDAVLGANELVVDIGGLIPGQTYELTVSASDLTDHLYHASRWRLDEDGADPRIVAGFQMNARTLGPSNGFTFLHFARATSFRLRASDVYWRASTEPSVVMFAGIVIGMVEP